MVTTLWVWIKGEVFSVRYSTWSLGSVWGLCEHVAVGFGSGIAFMELVLVALYSSMASDP